MKVKLTLTPEAAAIIKKMYLDGKLAEVGVTNLEEMQSRIPKKKSASKDFRELEIRRWVQRHWNGCLCVRWLKHLQGKRFWVELDREDFGLLQRIFPDDSLLVDRILDRRMAGKEDSGIMEWAKTWGISIDAVQAILGYINNASERMVRTFEDDLEYPPDESQLAEWIGDDPPLFDFDSSEQSLSDSPYSDPRRH